MRFAFASILSATVLLGDECHFGACIKSTTSCAWHQRDDRKCLGKCTLRTPEECDACKKGRGMCSEVCKCNYEPVSVGASCHLSVGVCTKHWFIPGEENDNGVKTSDDGSTAHIHTSSSTGEKTLTIKRPNETKQRKYRESQVN